MANFASKINRSIRGRDLGFQDLSSAESGSGNGTQRFLAGTVIGVRVDVTTAETTSANVKAHGLSQFGTTSTGTGSSAVYTLDPPIPGITKTIVLSCGASDGPIYIKTANSETIESTAGSSFTTMKVSTRGKWDLIGVTTARWFTAAASAAFVLLATST